MSSELSALVETAAKHADAADTERALHPDVVDQIVVAGFARHFVPQRWGGTGGTFTELYRAVATVAEGCASAAWCAGLAAGAARMGVYLPEEGQRELWASGPDTLVAGGLIPAGRVEPATGGWRLTGGWELTSGAAFSDWVLVCGLLPAAPRFFAVRRGDYQVADTWFATGMRGTASNTVILDDVFVPEHRSFPRDEMWHGRSVGSAARCHTVPLRVVSGLLFAPPALGAARAALRAWTALTARKGGSPPARDNPAVQVTLARAAGDIDAAAALLRRAAAVGDRASVTAGEAVRNPADCALAVEYLVGAVERLVRSAGTRGQRAADPLTRAWRDTHVIASHVALRFETAGSAYGAHLLSTEGDGVEH